MKEPSNTLAIQPNTNWLDKYIHPDDYEFVTDINECIREKKVLELELGWICSEAVPLIDSNSDIKDWIDTASDIRAPAD